MALPEKQTVDGNRNTLTYLHTRNKNIDEDEGKGTKDVKGGDDQVAAEAEGRGSSG